MMIQLVIPVSQNRGEKYGMVTTETFACISHHNHYFYNICLQVYFHFIDRYAIHEEKFPGWIRIT